ncbi:MAG TPA: hypothetical protein VGE01_13050, partial [Fimbriimonas sp.]
MRPVLPLTLLLLACAAPLSRADTKPALTAEDARQWEIPVETGISNDGRWVALGLRLVEGDGRLILKEVDTGRTFTIPRGSDPKFSDDGKRVAYRVLPEYDELSRLREMGKKVPSALGVRSLVDGTERLFGETESFEFLAGGRRLMVLGADKTLRLIDFEGAQDVSLGGVASAVADGSLERVAIAKEEGSSSVLVYDAKANALAELASGPFKASSLAWSKSSEALAFLVGVPVPDRAGLLNQLVTVTGLGGEAAKVRILDPTKEAGFPEGHRIYEGVVPSISDDAGTVVFGARKWDPAPSTPDGTTVEVWNSKDKLTLPERNASRDTMGKRALMYVWHPDEDKIIALNDSLYQEVSVLPGMGSAVVMDPRPYFDAANRNFMYWDVDVVSTRTGERTRAFTKADNPPAASATGSYVAAFDDGDWWVYHVEKRRRENLTKGLGVGFGDEILDFGASSEGPAAAPDWLAGDRGLLLYDRYDAWLFATDKGKVERVTSGRKSRRTFRLEPSLQARDADAKTMTFRCFDESAKSAGFWRAESPGAGSALLSTPAAVRMSKRARDADRVVYLRGSFEESPSLYVADGSFENPKPVLATNPQQSRFAW